VEAYVTITLLVVGVGGEVGADELVDEAEDNEDVDEDESFFEEEVCCSLDDKLISETCFFCDKLLLSLSPVASLFCCAFGTLLLLLTLDSFEVVLLDELTGTDFAFSSDTHEDELVLLVVLDLLVVDAGVICSVGEEAGSDSVSEDEQVDSVEVLVSLLLLTSPEPAEVDERGPLCNFNKVINNLFIHISQTI
jgi:hypothetical protein